jgi:two-component system sensor histidine kinase VicK
MEYLSPNSRLSFLNGGGEMGNLIQQYNWENTSVGSPDKWSPALHTAISIIINSKFPMFLWWGKDLIQFYNDAYRPSLGNEGKHPSALGQAGEDCWQEIWPIIKPLIDQVLAGGDSVWRENQLIPIYRNGKLDDVYWTFSYSAVNDGSGQVGGVLVVCTETTTQVNNLQIMKDKEQIFRNIFIEAPVAVAIMKGDTFIVDFANKKVLEYWGRTLDQVTNKPIFEALPEAAGQGLEALLKNVYTTGELYTANELPIDLFRNGKLEKTYINFVYEPYYDLAGDINGVIALANEVTDQVLTAKKIEEAEERARLAIESAQLGYYEKVILTGQMITDKSFNKLLDMVPPFTDADVMSAIHPEDKALRDKAYAEALLTGNLNYEARFIWKNDSIHWIKVTGKVVYDQHGTPEKMAGIVQDITVQKNFDSHKDDFISLVSHELKTPVTAKRVIVICLKQGLNYSKMSRR